MTMQSVIPEVSVRVPIELTSINTIRTLAIDGVQAANSGHPGAPMAMASVAYCLWQQFLRFDPQDPVWPNRDRFVLSIGHASTPPAGPNTREQRTGTLESRPSERQRLSNNG